MRLPFRARAFPDATQACLRLDSRVSVLPGAFPPVLPVILEPQHSRAADRTVLPSCHFLFPKERRVRDSNPRTFLGASRFRGGRTRPLCEPSSYRDAARVSRLSRRHFLRHDHFMQTPTFLCPRTCRRTCFPQPKQTTYFLIFTSCQCTCVSCCTPARRQGTSTGRAPGYEPS